MPAAHADAAGRLTGSRSSWQLSQPVSCWCVRSDAAVRLPSGWEWAPSHYESLWLRVIRLLCALDIPYTRVDLRLGRVSRSFVGGILCSEDLRLIHGMKIAIKCCGGNPLIC